MLRRLFNWIRSRIKYQLFISYALLSVILLSLFFAAATASLSRDLKKDKYNEVNTVNGQMCILLDKYIRDLNAFTLNYYYAEHMARTLNMANKKKGYDAVEYVDSIYSIRKSFAGAMETYQEFDGIYLFSLDGEPVHDIQRQGSYSGANVSGEPWFRDALEGHGLNLLRGRSLSYTGDHEVITIDRAFIDISTLKNIGVISIQINAESLGKALGMEDLSGTGITMILDKEEELVFSSDMEQASGILGHLQSEVQLEGEKQDFWMEYGGEQYYIILTPSSYTGWSVVTCVEKTDILRKTRDLQRILILLVLACIAVTFVFSYIYAGKASASLIRMTRYMKRFEQGELDLRIEVTGNNEIALLEKGFNSMSERIRELLEKEYVQNLLRQEAELKYLQNQINPHFLYNTLGMISYEAEKEEAPHAAGMIRQLAMIFQYNMGKAGNVVRLKEELTHIKNYLAIQQARFEDRLRVKYTLDETVMDVFVPRMILQPLVENSIIHSVERTCEPCEIHIATRREAKYCVIHIRDTGKGMSIAQVEELNALLDMDRNAVSCIEDMNARKMGVCNVHARIRYMFTKEYGLRYTYVKDGASVNIYLPLNFTGEGE